MSYVRFGPDSQVYAWHDGEKINCIVEYELQHKFPDMHFSNGGELFRYLMYLRDSGIKVPNYAIASTVMQSAEHKILKNASLPFFTKSKLYQSTNEAMSQLCPDVDDDSVNDSPLTNQLPDQ